MAEKEASKKGIGRFFGISKSKAADSDVSAVLSHNPDEVKKLMKACAEFAVSLYKKVTATSSGNQFFSPFSISMALAMTYLGARGETHAQMKSGMSYDKLDEQQLHKSFAYLRSVLKGGNDYTLHIANRLFGEKSYKFLDDFLKATQNFYGAQLLPVSFKHDQKSAVAEVNGWVEEQTMQKIKNIVPIDVVSEYTCLILVNAIYFKGDWVMKFHEDLTEEQDFHVGKDEKEKVQMMHRSGVKLNYGVNQKLNCQALELPYVGDKLSMFILLPDHSVTSVEEFERHLTADHLINVRQEFQMRERNVNVWLPRFKLVNLLELSRVLKNMGMNDMFTERADFSGMDGTKYLSVSAVLHKAFVEVNEEGSEAAAATAVVMAVEKSVKVKRVEVFDFRADHPFIFFIQDVSTQSTLFLGKFARP